MPYYIDIFFRSILTVVTPFTGLIWVKLKPQLSCIFYSNCPSKIHVISFPLVRQFLKLWDTTFLNGIRPGAL